MNDIDPNIALGAITIVGTFLGWLWSKVRVEKSQDIRSLLSPVIRAEVAEALANERSVEWTREKLRNACYLALSYVGVGESRAKPYVDFAVEQGIAELRALTHEREQEKQDLTMQLESMLNSAISTKELFEAKGNQQSLNLEWNRRDPNE